MFTTPDFRPLLEFSSSRRLTLIQFPYSILLSTKYEKIYYFFLPWWQRPRLLIIVNISLSRCWLKRTAVVAKKIGSERKAQKQKQKLTGLERATEKNLQPQQSLWCNKFTGKFLSFYIIIPDLYTPIVILMLLLLLLQHSIIIIILIIINIFNNNHIQWF